MYLLVRKNWLSLTVMKLRTQFEFCSIFIWINKLKWTEIFVFFYTSSPLDNSWGFLLFELIMIEFKCWIGFFLRIYIVSFSCWSFRKWILVLHRQVFDVTSLLNIFLGILWESTRRTLSNLNYCNGQKRRKHQIQCRDLQFCLCELAASDVFPRIKY